MIQRDPHTALRSAASPEAALARTARKTSSRRASAVSQEGKDPRQIPGAREARWTESSEEGEAFLDLVEAFLLGERTLGDAMGISREDVETMAALGDQLLESGHVEQAREVYEGCAVLHPADSVLLARLATCADLEGRAADRDAYLEALEQTWQGEDGAILRGFLQRFPDRTRPREAAAPAGA